MKFRWTMKQLKEMTDAQVLRGLIAERKSELNPYTPFAERLQSIYNDLDRQIAREREAKKEAESGNKTTEILFHEISYYYEDGQEMPDHEQDHVKGMINEGYSQGQLNDGGNYGWWRIAK